MDSIKKSEVKVMTKNKSAVWFGKRLSSGATSNLYIISILGLLICLISAIYTLFDIYEEINECVIYGDVLDMQYYSISFMMEGVFIIFFIYSIIACRRGK